MAALDNAGYYEAMAQALPVLFIVLVVQYGGTRASWDPLRRIVPRGETVVPLLALAVGLWIGLGEFAALDVLRRQEVSSIDAVLIDGALSLAAVGLLAPVTVSIVEELGQRGATARHKQGSRRQASAVYLVVATTWLLAIAYFSPITPLR